MRQGLELADKGDLFGAIRHTEQLIKEFPDFPPGLCLLGDLYLQVGSPALAIDPLEKAVAAAPQHPYSQFLLGCGLGRTGNFTRAIHHLLIADQLRPNNPEILRNLGWMKSMHGEVKEGRELLRKSIRLNPKNSLAYNDLGVSYMFTSDMDLRMAKRYIGKALELDPENKFIQGTWKSFQEMFHPLSRKNKAGENN
jgi:Flp pilus assembly protein TadD